MQWFGASFVVLLDFYNFRFFLFSQFWVIVEHITLFQLFSFYFNLEDRTIVLNVTVPCYCLSLTIHDHSLVLFHFLSFEYFVSI